MTTLHDLESDLKRAIRRHGVPGASVAVLRNRRIIARAAAGVTNVETRVPVTPDTVFQIGSITKVFTATLVMQLVDAGLLNLDTPIVEYLPEFRVADAVTRKAVTARHFLTHTSGIDGDFFPDAGRGDDCIARFVDMCAMLPSLYPLGERMSYCNVGFAVLGRVIEVLTGQTFDAVIRRRIFKPLGMRHAMTLPEYALRFRCAIGHAPDPKRPQESIVAPVPYLSHGQKAAGSTPTMSAPDLLEFVAMHLHGGRNRAGVQILSSRSVAAMQRRHVKLPKHAPNNISGWGLGWLLCDWNANKVIGHDGGTIGQRAFLRVYPQAKFAVAMLTNGGDAAGLYRDIFSELFAAQQRLQEPDRPQPNPALRVDPARYAGRFENIASGLKIDRTRAGLVASGYDRTGTGTPGLEPVHLEFVDANTAVVRSRNPLLDGLSFLFSAAESGRSPLVQMGLRQFRRVE